jgi:hypothetical protein
MADEANKLRVVDFPGHNVQDIPRMLRAMADEIEADKDAAPAQMLCVGYREDAQRAEIDLFILGGDLRTATILGVLEMAKDYVLRPE